MMSVSVTVSVSVVTSADGRTPESKSSKPRWEAADDSLACSTSDVGTASGPLSATPRVVLTGMMVERSGISQNAE